MEASKNLISYHIQEDPEPDISVAPSTRNSLLAIVYFRLWLSKQTTYKINRTCTFEVRLVKCPKQQHVWEQYEKQLETVGTKVWFRCSLPGLERNGVNYRQNGVNCRQNGVNPNKEISSQSSALHQGFICSHYLYKWQSVSAQCRGCTLSRLSKKHRIPRIIPVSV